jgi:hypothetical protein
MTIIPDSGKKPGYNKTTSYEEFTVTREQTEAMGAKDYEVVIIADLIDMGVAPCPKSLGDFERLLKAMRKSIVASGSVLTGRPPRRSVS